MSAAALQPELAARNRRVGLTALAFALAMLGLGYASVPLYRLFCQVTGFGGTTQRASEAQAAAVSLSGEDASRSASMPMSSATLPWQFRPERTTDDDPARRAAHGDLSSHATLSDKPITGRATFNVEPEQAGRYFNKVQCFCFTEQTLQPGQEVRMPVVYFVDPKMLDDADAKDIQEITLSYTFHPIADGGAKALDRARAGG